MFAAMAFQWVIAAAMGLGLLHILWTGQIRLYLAPPSWHRVSRREDPGRFWAFVTAVAFVTAALIANLLFP